MGGLGGCHSHLMHGQGFKEVAGAEEEVGIGGKLVEGSGNIALGVKLVSWGVRRAAVEGKGEGEREGLGEGAKEVFSGVDCGLAQLGSGRAQVRARVGLESESFRKF